MDLLKPLIALLAIVNPIGVDPVLHRLHAELQPRAAAAHDLGVAASAPSSSSPSAPSPGLKIIEFFGISIASFQVGGGTLLLISSLQMLNAQPAESQAGRRRRRQPESRRRRQHRHRAADDPAADRPGDDLDDGDLRRKDAPPVGARGAGRLRRGHRPGRPTSPSRASARIAKVLGRTGINVMTRLMGLILAAMAVELLADGLVKLFPVLASHIAR